MTEQPAPLVLYRLATSDEWSEALALGIVPYRDIDRRDGYTHLSTEAQALETARRHFRERTELLALEIDPAGLDAPLRFEPGGRREGELFPHLYGALPTSAVRRVRRIARGANDRFSFEGEE